MLERINTSNDVKKLNLKEKEKLAKEIRNYIIKIVSKNGGHLASNLGVVELTIAINSIFNPEKDKIIWDVGHQTYIHKIINGRKKELKTLRTLGGIAGFPKTSESITDCFNTGHSSTSISAALGMARARDIKHKKNNVIAIIGDGALTGGMALEALNDAGTSNTDIKVILNDNEMSISKNIGGINTFLGKLRTKKMYTKSNNYIKKALTKIPILGKPTIKTIQKLKKSIKQLIIPKMYFEDIGFTYLGPVDGHNIEQLENILKLSKKITGPVLIHVRTIKGKGYEYAEKNPDKYHSTSPFNIETGKSINKKEKDFSKVFGDTITELAKKNKNIVAITASMTDGTGLSNFKKEFPNRFFDVGIAEQHAITLAAGMAKEKMIPIIPIYSSFYQRAYDQIIHDVAMQNLPVIMCVDRAGIVGQDGETHQGLLDMAAFRIVPNLTIMAPSDFHELKAMITYATKLNQPVMIRYPRGTESKTKIKNHQPIKQGNGEILKKGKDLTIIAIGTKVPIALNIAKALEKHQIDTEIINARFIKPFPKTQIKKSIIKTKKVITIEDGTIIGGLSTIIKELIIDENLNNIKVKSFAYPDQFIPHGTINELEKKYKLDEETIINTILTTYYSKKESIK